MLKHILYLEMSMLFRQREKLSGLKKRGDMTAEVECMMIMIFCCDEGHYWNNW